MSTSSWRDLYETGDPVIDQQHRELLALVDSLEEVEVHSKETHDPNGAQAVYAVLDHIMDFAASHFLMEEELMLRVEFPNFEQQEMVQQHRRFVADARHRVLEFRAGRLISVLPLRDFLSAWLTEHEFGLDRRLADFAQCGKHAGREADQKGAGWDEDPGPEKY